MSETAYKKYLKLKENEWENLCIRCGGCCGAYDDPCKHLKKAGAGKFYCAVYETRFGDQLSLKGEEFKCVPVKEILNTHWKKDYLCVYKKYRKKSWIK